MGSETVASRGTKRPIDHLGDLVEMARAQLAEIGAAKTGFDLGFWTDQLGTTLWAMGNHLRNERAKGGGDGGE